MITLSPGSLCDVCAEEYGPRNYPHCIPCGHVLCASCCNSIIQKSPPRHSPSCPFCREQFSSDTVRLIRIDFSPSSSGWSTPRQFDATRPIVDDTGDDDPLSLGPKSSTAKVLEYKVSRIAAKKCSVEEVSMMHKELQDWLADNRNDGNSALKLSALLLRAILMNHFAHSEASKAAKHTENHMRDQLDAVESAKEKLDAELRSLRTQFSQTAQECQSLRAELNRYKVRTVAPVLGVPTTPPPKSFSALQPSPGGVTSPPRPQSVQPSSPTPGQKSRATSPTSPGSYAPSIHSPLGPRFTAPVAHARSASVAPPSLHRSATPLARSHTPAAPLLRSESARPSTPHKPRSTSISSPAPPLPTKMMRSTSNESSSDEILSQKDKERDRHMSDKDAKRVQLIQRWLPSSESTSPPTGRFGWPANMAPGINRPMSTTGSSTRSRTISTAATPTRFRTPGPVSTHSP